MDETSLLLPAAQPASHWRAAGNTRRTEAHDSGPHRDAMGTEAAASASHPHSQKPSVPEELQRGGSLNISTGTSLPCSPQSSSWVLICSCLDYVFNVCTCALLHLLQLHLLTSAGSGETLPVQALCWLAVQVLCTTGWRACEDSSLQRYRCRHVREGRRAPAARDGCQPPTVPCTGCRLLEPHQLVGRRGDSAVRWVTVPQWRPASSVLWMMCSANAHAVRGSSLRSEVLSR
jgi:hypothetical protein